MKVYGDLFLIENGFLTLMDYKLQYSDVYLTYTTDEKDEFIPGFLGKKEWFVDENCWAWESIDHLSLIMAWSGAGIKAAFWEDDDE